MDWMYLFYFLLGMLIFFGAQYAGRGKWNEEYTSLRQTKVLEGIMIFFIALHHMAQKTCAPWHPRIYTVHGLDVFVQVGYLFVGVFFFCSGLGLYRSLHSKPDYLKGFCRRRIMPLVIAFYLSEFIYTAVRLAMGQKMDAKTVVWYLSGLHMANFNAWYLIVIPFFYLVFRAAFRRCKREGTAIFLVFLFTIGYTVLGAFIDHQDDWWMQGEWWYNSILLFPMGLLFGKYERRATEFFKRGYLFWLVLSFAAAVILFYLSEWVNNGIWGYYDARYSPMKVPHRLMSAGLQWLVALAYTAFCFLLMMKVKLGNKALAWLGSVTLSFYLMHGIFVELFGYNFLDISKSLVYIKSVPLYIAAVLTCSVIATIVFDRLWKCMVHLTGKSGSGGKNVANARIALKERKKSRKTTAETAYGQSWIRRNARHLVIPGLIVLALLVLELLPVFRGNGSIRVMNGMVFELPEHYTARYSDSRYAAFEYRGNDRRPGILIVDGEIRDEQAGFYSKAEDVLACDWLRQAELYVNPQGVRMVRGFVDYSGSAERRYYIESPASVFLMCINENEQFYSRQDCEEAILQVADSFRPAS